MARCEAKTRSGEPCKAPALNGKRRCYHHSEEVAVERAEARHRGGVNRRRPKALTGQADAGAVDQRVTVADPRDVVAILERAINDTLRLETGHQRSRTLGYLCGQVLKAFELRDLAARLEAVETVLKARNAR